MGKRYYGSSFNRELEKERKRKERIRIKEEKERLKYKMLLDKENAIEYGKNITKEAEDERTQIVNLLKDGFGKKININWEKYIDKLEYNEKLDLKVLPKKPDESLYKVKLTLLNRLIPSIKNKQQKELDEKLEKDMKNWEDNCNEIENRNNEVEKEWKKKKEQFEKGQREENDKIYSFQKNYEDGKKDGIEFYFNEIISKSKYPSYFLGLDWEIFYNEENKVMVIDYSLPKKSEINNIKQVKYVQIRKEYSETYLKESDINKIYEDGLYQLCLRINYDIYNNDKLSYVESIVFNGYLTDINKRTGKEETQCILSLQTEKEKFMDLNLSLVDARECFKSLKGVSGSKLHELVPVAPIINIDKEDKRFVESREIGEKINGYNLAAMHWEDFEHLIRELFEKEFSANGSEIKITQASRDGGVDAIMFDPDPIKGGKYIIQAKRYTSVVGVSAVRDLYGTVLNEGASKGILVTTSDYGLDSYNFAKDKPITLLNGSNLLHMLEKHGYEARIDLKEAKIELNKTENNR